MKYRLHITATKQIKGMHVVLRIYVGNSTEIAFIAYKSSTCSVITGAAVGVQPLGLAQELTVEDGHRITAKICNNICKWEGDV